MSLEALLAAHHAPLLSLSAATETRLLGVVLSVIFLILCVAVHEFGHAWVADRLGDPLPRADGRVTLNPLAHIDLLGTVIFPALMAFGLGVPLAWGKPVVWTANPRYLTRRYSLRTMKLMVSVAGPGMNLALALASSALFLLVAALGHPRIAYDLCRPMVAMNLGLMFFNLLPIPPLDGRSFLEFLPRPLSALRDFLMNYGSYIFLALVLIPSIGNGPGPLYYIMSPFYWLIDAYLGLLTGFIP